MRDQIASVLMIALIFIVLPVLILRVRDRMTRARRYDPNPRAARAADRQAYEQRILQPDWACVERHLRRSVPEALRMLYANRTLVTSRDLQYSMNHSISTFEALDQQAMADARAWLGFEAVAFATTDMGDSIYLRPGSSEVNSVYLTHHDGGDTEVLAATLDEMVDTLVRQDIEGQR